MLPTPIERTYVTVPVLLAILLLGATALATGAEAVVIHDRDRISGVFHGPDDAASGLITWVSNELFVTTANVDPAAVTLSSPAEVTGALTPSINLAVPP